MAEEEEQEYQLSESQINGKIDFKDQKYSSVTFN